MTESARVYKIDMIETRTRHRGLASFRELLDEREVSPATLKPDHAFLKYQLRAPNDYDRVLNDYRFGQELRRQYVNESKLVIDVPRHAGNFSGKASESLPAQVRKN